MKTYNKILLGLFGVMALTTGCKDKMTEINTDPNTMSDSKVQFMFTKATEKFGYEKRDDLTGKFSGPMQLMQYLAKYAGNPGANAGWAPTQEVGNPTGSELYYWKSDYLRLTTSGAALRHIVQYCDGVTAEAKPDYADVRAIADFMFAHYQWKAMQHYGAFPYVDGFTAVETDNLKPAYQTLTDKLASGLTVWQDIDRRIAASIKVLEADAPDDVVKLGDNDFFNGWWNTTKVTDYDVQRGNWRKYMNMSRLEMAWVLKKVEPANFETVKTQVLAVKDGLMTQITDGTYYHYSWNYDNEPDDVNAISEYYGIGEAFMNTLKRLGDPRLPLLARPSAANALSSRSYRFMQEKRPDSLALYPVLDGTANSYFVGLTNNPKNYDEAYYPQTDGTFNSMSRIYKDFQMINPNGDNAYEFMNEGELDTISSSAKFTVQIQVPSSPQGRYFVKCGGRKEKNGPWQYIDEDINTYRFDGLGGEFTDLRLRKPVFTYAKQCFMLAVLEITTLDGTTPAQWYEKGVTAAMTELSDDADTYGIQIATNGDYPDFPGLNSGFYSYDAGDISTYLAANSYVGIEKTMEQAWIYFYQQPETMYQWWLLTGYPEIKTHANSTDAANDTAPYLEQMYKDVAGASIKLVYPRRGVLPDRASINADNYENIKQQLLGQPNYGTWKETLGRQWWDVN